MTTIRILLEIEDISLVEGIKVSEQIEERLESIYDINILDVYEVDTIEERDIVEELDGDRLFESIEDLGKVVFEK